MTSSSRPTDSTIKVSSHSKEFVILFVVIFGLLSIVNSLRISDSTLRDSTVLIANEYSNAANLIVSTMVLDKNSSSEGTKALLEEMVNTAGSRLLYVVIQAPNGKTMLRVGTAPKTEARKVESAGRSFAGFRMIDTPVEVTKNVLLPHNIVGTMTVGIIGPTFSLFDVFSQVISFVMLIGLSLLSYSRSVASRIESHNQNEVAASTPATGAPVLRVIEQPSEDTAVVNVFGQGPGRSGGA